ncbi:MAG: hypothetical protein HRT88_22135 [Lentisphaeraceae bacterium]|nr:hypothetical protein [Lentisphaeraceae bacterium]
MKKIILLALPCMLFIGFVLSLLFESVSTRYVCHDCIAQKQIFIKRSPFGSEQKEEISNKFFLKNFIDKPHKHIWTQIQQSRSNLYQRSCGVGGNRRLTQFAYQLEHAFFQIFILDKLEKEELSKEQIIQYSLIKYESEQTKQEADKLIDESFEK